MRAHPVAQAGAERYARAMRLRLVFPLMLLLAATGTAWCGDFVEGTEDVPLMPGLAAIAGSALVFDKPEGRIVEAQARGRLARAKVRAFYAASLPPLGWRAAGTNLWRRDAERLRLDFRGPDGDLTVGFTLSP
jgi:hypothetical protein